MTEKNPTDRKWLSSGKRPWHLIGYLVLAILIVWIYIKTQPARRQANAVSLLHELGDQVEIVIYDFHLNPKGGINPRAKPTFLVNLVGKDYFHNVVAVTPGFCRDIFNDRALAHLEALPHLRAVHLSTCDISDEGLVHLEGLKHIENLSLSYTPITDAGLKHLSGLSKLKYITLEETRITDEGLKYLYGLSSLKSINLNVTRVTEQGVKDLQSKLPNAQISWVKNKK